MSTKSLEKSLQTESLQCHVNKPFSRDQELKQNKLQSGTIFASEGSRPDAIQQKTVPLCPLSQDLNNWMDLHDSQNN